MSKKFNQKDPGTWHLDPKRWHGRNNNGCIPMPDGFLIRNGSQECDMAAGPCSCGAWHSRADWTWKINNDVMGYSAHEKKVFSKLIQVVDEEEQAVAPKKAKA